MVGVAPDRAESINRRLATIEKEIGEKIVINCQIVYIDLFHEKGFVYEHGIQVCFGGIRFHPNYEAKAFKWLFNSVRYKQESTLMWITGSEPKGV